MILYGKIKKHTIWLLKESDYHMNGSRRGSKGQIIVIFEFGNPI
jgi:hypothetical protein